MWVISDFEALAFIAAVVAMTLALALVAVG
jgi:hypothetical protein